MAVKIAFTNQKGGVSKTTSAINVAYELTKLKNRAGKTNRVLLIDADQQRTATIRLLKEKNHVPNLYHLLFQDIDPRIKREINSEITVQDVIVKSEEFEVDVIPSSPLLADYTDEIKRDPNQLPISHFADYIQGVEDYDYVLIDTHPSLSLFLLCSLGYADHIIIPITPSEESIEGIDELLTTVQQANKGRKRIGKQDINTLGVLPTKFIENRNFHKEVLKAIEEMPMFKTNIHFTVRAEEANCQKQPISKYDPAAKAGAEYLQVAKQIQAQFAAGDKASRIGKKKKQYASVD